MGSALFRSRLQERSDDADVLAPVGPQRFQIRRRLVSSCFVNLRGLCDGSLSIGRVDDIRSVRALCRVFFHFPPQYTHPIMTQQAVKRLQAELKGIVADPIPLADARPDSTTILRWYYIVEGAKGTPYEGGEYIGQLVFPNDYPYRPPQITMTTPSGRFATRRRLCLTISDYHPEKWSPIWGVRQIVMGLHSFMNEDKRTVGSVESTKEQKMELAKASHSFNVDNFLEFAELFPDRYVAALQKAEDIRPSRVAAAIAAVPNPTEEEEAAALMKMLTDAGVADADDDEAAAAPTSYDEAVNLNGDTTDEENGRADDTAVNGAASLVVPADAPAAAPETDAKEQATPISKLDVNSAQAAAEGGDDHAHHHPSSSSIIMIDPRSDDVDDVMEDEAASPPTLGSSPEAASVVPLPRAPLCETVEVTA